MTGSEYKYAYDIEDPTTGDTKSQHEVRQGNIVKGAYSVLDPDGTRRTVHYTVDPKHGFQAIVTQEPVEPVMLIRQPYIHLPQELSTDNRELSYPYDTVLEDYAIDTDPYAQTSLSGIRSPLMYFTPANELNNNKGTESGQQYLTPNRNYKYPSN